MGQVLFLDLGFDYIGSLSCIIMLCVFFYIYACVHPQSPQLCLILCDPMDYSPPDSSVLGYSPGKNTGVGCHALFQGIFPTQRLNPRLLYWRVDSLPLVLPGKPTYAHTHTHTHTHTCIYIYIFQQKVFKRETRRKKG